MQKVNEPGSESEFGMAAKFTLHLFGVFLALSSLIAGLAFFGMDKAPSK